MAKAKKKASKKKAAKRKYTPPVKFEDFTPAVQKSAKAKVAYYKGDGAWRLERAAQGSLPKVPTKKRTMVKVEEKVSSDGKGWANVNHPVENALKNIQAAVTKAKKKGAKDCKLQMSNWHGVTITGYREETDAEFKKRVHAAQVDRATIILARASVKDVRAKEAAKNRKFEKERRENRFRSAARDLSDKDIKRLLEEIEKEKKAKKEPSKKKTTPFL